MAFFTKTQQEEFREFVKNNLPRVFLHLYRKENVISSMIDELTKQSEKYLSLNDVAIKLRFNIIDRATEKPFNSNIEENNQELLENMIVSFMHGDTKFTDRYMYFSQVYEGVTLSESILYWDETSGDGWTLLIRNSMIDFAEHNAASKLVQ